MRLSGTRGESLPMCYHPRRASDMVWWREWGSPGAWGRSERQEGARLWDGCEREEEEGTGRHREASLPSQQKATNKMQTGAGVRPQSRAGGTPPERCRMNMQPWDSPAKESRSSGGWARSSLILLCPVAAAGREPQARTFGAGEKMSGSGVPQGEGTALCATIESKIKEALQVPLPPSSPHSSLASKSSFIPTSGESHTTPRLPFAAP